MQSAGLHYERAFAHDLRERRAAHVCVDEARRLLLPVDGGKAGVGTESGLKFFDYVLYGQRRNLLVELKGRRVALAAGRGEGELRAARRLECWVTSDDIASLQRWEALFGPPFEAVIVFVYWCESEPPGTLFQRVFEHEGRWYAPRAISVRDYLSAMRVRSPRWRTVDLAQADFERLSRPFDPADVAGEGAVLAPGASV